MTVPSKEIQEYLLNKYSKEAEKIMSDYILYGGSTQTIPTPPQQLKWSDLQLGSSFNDVNALKQRQEVEFKPLPTATRRRFSAPAEAEFVATFSKMVEMVLNCRLNTKRDLITFLESALPGKDERDEQKKEGNPLIYVIFYSDEVEAICQDKESAMRTARAVAINHVKDRDDGFVNDFAVEAEPVHIGEFKMNDKLGMEAARMTQNHFTKFEEECERCGGKDHQ